MKQNKQHIQNKTSLLTSICQPKGGETPLNGYKKKRRAIIEIDGIKHHILLSKIVLLCGDCNKPIKNANSLNKKFCDDCIKKHRYEKSRRWLKNHPRKNAIYQKDKNIRNRLRDGGELRIAITTCIICGKNISMYHSNSKYCQQCSKLFSNDRLHTLGTRHISPYMRRTYDYDNHKGIPDFKKESITIENEMRSIGLK